jgi:hypothetical protein
MIKLLFIFLFVVALLLAVRYAVHRFRPGSGTNAASIVGMIGMALQPLLDFAEPLIGDAVKLPWADIMDAGAAKAVAFAGFATMMILRNLKRLPAPPPLDGA